MKTTFTTLLILFSMSFAIAQNLELPFFDDFEETVSSDGTFFYWTTENLAAWQYWHIFYGNMRFENNDLDQNDWLITKPIKTTGADSLVISFNTFYKHQGTKPKFLYTSEYTGDAQNDTWNEIEYELGEVEEQWHSSGDIVIKSPDSTVWFAFHSNQEANKGIYFLLDNFSVSKYEPLIVAKAGSSNYFDFYSEAENSSYWDSISNQVDIWYEELCSYWDRPGLPQIFDAENKTSIYLLNEDEFENQSAHEIHDWKCGYSKNSNTLITKLPDGEKSLYNNSYSNLLKNLLGQFMLTKHFGNNVDDYFKEAFGLFYTGYQPKRDSILKAISIVGETPSVDVLQDLTDLPNNYKKDLITSFVESKVLSVGGVQGCYGGGITEHWHNHLRHYYSKPENERIKLLKQTERFNIYASDSELPYLNDVGNKLEERMSLYETLFDFPVKHRFYCVVYPSGQVRTDCLIFSGGDGGSGWSGDKLDIATNDLSTSNTDVYHFLIPHELFHVFHFNIVEHLFKIPSLYSEGLANYISLYQDDNYLDGSEHAKYKIEYAFNHYVTNYNVEPKFEHILNSQPDENYGGYCNDPYYLGELFYKYFFEKEGDFSDLRTFFLSGLDYTKIGKNYDDIDKGYISFIKEYANLKSANKLVEMPFEEPFNDFNKGWTKPCYKNPDNWQIKDGAANSKYIGFYTYSDKNVPIESWLITPPLDAQNMEQVNFSFDFMKYKEGIDVEVLYTNKFEEYTDSTEWTSLQKLSMSADWSWTNSGKITVPAPPDTLFIGFKMNTTGKQHQQFAIDNFKVVGNITGVKEIAENDINLKIYPNPVSINSEIHFTLKEPGKVELAIFDIQGKKIADITNQMLTAGNYNFLIGQHLTKKGFYLCKLQTNNNISTVKLVVE